MDLQLKTDTCILPKVIPKPLGSSIKCTEQFCTVANANFLPCQVITKVHQLIDVFVFMAWQQQPFVPWSTADIGCISNLK